MGILQLALNRVLIDEDAVVQSRRVSTENTHSEERANLVAEVFSETEATTLAERQVKMIERIPQA